MARGTLVLATLLPALLHGACDGDAPVDDDVECGEEFETETTWITTRDAETVEATLDGFGEVTDEGCPTLCSTGFRSPVQRVLDVSSCEVADPVEGRPWEQDVWCSGEVVAVTSCVITGRAHATLRRAPVRPGRDPARAWFARTAWEEAASVGAFRRLARELARGGAPASLVERAREAARDEIRHARTMRRLAGTFERPRFDAERPRDLREIGLENAVEGCVRETFAALVALHQARAAEASLRPVFARIATDETRHGQWSWDLDAWLRTRLPSAEVAALDEARAAAADALVDGVCETAPAARRVLGLPAAATARRLARGLAAAIRGAA